MNKKLSPINIYNNHQMPTVPLKDVTTYFKGKAVSKLGTKGNISVVNLSNISETGIDYDNLKKYDCNEERLLHYLLQDGDVLIASKGTVKKTAVFKAQKTPVIASSNITILRPNSDILGGYIKLFLDSERGQILLDKVNTGKQVMNLNTQKLVSIEIPILPVVKQAYLFQRYEQGLIDYKRKLDRAQQEWQRICNDIEKNLF